MCSRKLDHHVADLRKPLLSLTAVTALLGIAGGIGRSGLLAVPPQVAASHDFLMTVAVLGSLVALERTGPGPPNPSHSGPALLAVSGLAASAAPTGPLAAALASVGSAVAVASSLGYYLRHRSVALGLIAGGFASLAASSLLIALGAPLLRVLPLVMCYPLLVIAGERVELASGLQRLSRGAPGWARGHHAAALLLLAVGIASLAAFSWQFEPLFGIPLIAGGLWLLLRDPVVRVGMRAKGIHRYVALNMTAGYSWLAAAGVLHLISGPLGLPVQLKVHSFYLGFVFHAIVAHAPLILPALVGIGRPLYSRWLYGSTGLLTPSLILRFAGISTGALSAYLTGVALNAVSIAVLAAVLTLNALRKRTSEAG